MTFKVGDIVTPTAPHPYAEWPCKVYAIDGCRDINGNMYTVVRVGPLTNYPGSHHGFSMAPEGFVKRDDLRANLHPSWLED